jgi:hypothetical protein
MTCEIFSNSSQNVELKIWISSEFPLYCVLLEYSVVTENLGLIIMIMIAVCHWKLQGLQTTVEPNFISLKNNSK